MTDQTITERYLDKALDKFEVKIDKKMDQKINTSEERMKGFILKEIKASEERAKEHNFEMVSDAADKILEGVSKMLEIKPTKLEKLETKVLHNTQEIREIKAQLATN